MVWERERKKNGKGIKTIIHWIPSTLNGHELNSFTFLTFRNWNNFPETKKQRFINCHPFLSPQTMATQMNDRWMQIQLKQRNFWWIWWRVLHSMTKWKIEKFRIKTPTTYAESNENEISILIRHWEDDTMLLSIDHCARISSALLVIVEYLSLWFASNYVKMATIQEKFE